MVDDLADILPEKIKIGYSYHPIEIQDDKWMNENNATGDSNEDTKVINICDSWDWDTVVDTLKHEIRHLLYSFFGLPEIIPALAKAGLFDEIEEVIIRTVTTGEQMVMHDNPELKRIFYG